MTSSYSTGDDDMAHGSIASKVCQSDFEKLISETSATEAEAAKIYDEFMADSDQDPQAKRLII